MTILQSATYQGINVNRVRPRALSTSASLRDMVEDQSHIYETITNLATPSAAGIVATPHIHDGTTGAKMRIPIAGEYLGARLFEQPVNLAITPAWAPFIWTPVFIEPGITTVSLVLWTTDWEAVRGSVRARLQNSTAVDNEDPVMGRALPIDHPFAAEGLVAVRYRLTATANAVNLLRVDAWDGTSLPGADDDDAGLPIGARNIVAWQLLPVPIAPNADLKEAQTVANTSTMHTVAASYQSTDSAFFATDRSINSYLLAWAAKNDALLYEVLTGRPAGYRATATFTGHNHVDQGATSLNDSGDEIKMSLGAWSYGVCRRRSSTDSDHMTNDEMGVAPPAADNAWMGRIFAPTLLVAATTGIVARHKFRFPRTLLTSRDGAGGFLNFAAWVRHNGDPLDSLTVTVTVGDTPYTTTAAAKSASVSALGDTLLTISDIDADVDGLANSVHGEDVCTLQVQLANNSATKGRQEYAIRGCCLYFNG